MLFRSRALANAILEPLRAAAAGPLRVTSGYRSPALNARIKGSATSQHSKGQAADLQSDSLAALELFKRAIQAKLPFDQIIYEAKNRQSRWVHVSHAAGANRGEIRVARFDASGNPVDYPKVTAEQALAMTVPTTRSRKLVEAYEESADEPAAPVAAKKVAVKQAAAEQLAVKQVAAKKVAVKKVVAKTVATKKPAVKRAAPATTKVG